jgi:DNA replication licensing factor MCM5
MSGFDIGRQYTAQLPGEANRASTSGGANGGSETLAQTEAHLFEFIQRFRLGNDFIYRDRLRANLLAKHYVIEILLEHIQLWSAKLAQDLKEKPGDILPLVSYTGCFSNTLNYC